jgi:hypothetical protein
MFRLAAKLCSKMRAAGATGLRFKVGQFESASNLIWPSTHGREQSQILRALHANPRRLLRSQQPGPVSRDQLPKRPINEFFFIELGVGERP